jgi:hypothetical protein
MVSFIIVAAEDGAEMGTYLSIQDASTVHQAMINEAQNFLNDAFSDDLNGKLTVALAEWVMSEPGSFEDLESINNVVEEIASYEPGDFSYQFLAIQATHHEEKEAPPMFKSSEAW